MPKSLLAALLLTLAACSDGPGHGPPAGAVRDAPRGAEVAARRIRQDGNAGRGDAEQATLALFAQHEVVGLGILSYANQDFNGFILNLIRNPSFPGQVNDIVIECGNVLYQPVLDRYVAGEDVPLADVQPVWRNTTQPWCGVAGFFDELVPLVRRVNQSLPPASRLRILAGDPPVDWSQVRSERDLRKFGDRDGSIAEVMEREVLARHRKALMIFGVRHLRHGGSSAVQRYERHGFPGRSFIIMAHNGFGNHTPLAARNDALEAQLATLPVPSLVVLKGSWLDTLDVDYFPPGDHPGRHISSSVDGYLYLGPADLLLNAPIPAAALLDTAYMAELKRRSDLRAGPMGVEQILREVREAGAFFN
jgi:hypothetical protein